MFLEDHSEYIQHLIEPSILYPIAINIEITTYCNLRCIMCPKTSGISRTPANKTIPPEILNKIMDEVTPNISRIDLVGDGEVLLEPSLFQLILEQAKKHKVLVNTSTNATLLTDEMSTVIVKGGLHDLNISMDASKPETFRKIRGSDMKKVLQNIQSLNHIKQELNIQTPYLHFSMVGMNQNISELPDLVQLASSYGASSVTLQAMGEFEPVKNQSVFLRNKKLGRKYLKEALSVSAKLGIQLDLWPENQFEEINEEDHSNYQQYRKDCNLPWEVPYFATDGSVRPCCAMPPMGNLYDQTFHEIWTGEKYNQLRSSIKTLNLPTVCRKCPGRGWHPPTNPSTIYKPGQNDTQLGLGWFETEENLSGIFRWAREKATVFLKGNSGSILSLDIETASETNTTQNIDIILNDQETISQNFQSGKRKTIHVNISDVDKPLHKVTIQGTPWRPVDTIPNTKDPRHLTVKCYGASISANNVHTCFENNIEFIACNAPKEISLSNKFIPIDFFWKSKTLILDTVKLYLHAFNTPHKYRNLAYFIQECRKKTSLSKMRFQIDIALPDIIANNEIQKQTVFLPIPDGQPPGSYTIIGGLYRVQNKRLRISNTQFPTYRNGVVLCQVSIQG